MSTCCPNGAAEFLQDEYMCVGTIVTLADGTEFYESVNTETSNGKAVIICPDIFGWAGGRIRRIADYFAKIGYYVIVAKVLVPAYEGGTEGDALPSTFLLNSPEKKMEWIQYMKTIPWETGIRPKISSLLQHSQEKGFSQVSSIGFCWGGWVLAKMATEWPDRVSCGCVPHPTLTAEEFIWSGSTAALVQQVKCPILLMPTQGDPDSYRGDGEIISILKANNAASETTAEFDNVHHGFMPRGDIMIPEIDVAVKRSFEVITEFLAKNA